MEGVKVVSISDLLRHRRPISGVFSLHFSYFPSAPSPSSPSDAKTLISNPRSNNFKVLKSMAEPSILIGTLDFPSFEETSSSNSSNSHNCFSFSDGSDSICCDVLGFELCMVGKKVKVVSWNFIPFKQKGGVLEIVKWEYLEDHLGSVDCKCDAVDSFQLGLGLFNVGNGGSKSGYGVYGVLEAISPVSVVPCTIGGGDNDKSGRRNTQNLRGFIAEISCCDCELCKANCYKENSGCLIRGKGGHSFRRRVFVYFSGSGSSWHPAISKLTGKVILVLGLRKKLVYIEKEEAQLMYMTTEKTRFHLQNLQNKGPPFKNSGVKKRDEFGVYTGVVRSVYMQGMVLELDEDVWLLVTDQLLAPPHSLRVGAVVSMRNIHFVRARFCSRKMLVLGACCKTSFTVVSFSPLETGCYMLPHFQSVLSKYIQSLDFSSRLWVILLTQCLRKKLAGTFSEKEILGTKHKEGLAQTYARSVLPLQFHQSRRGVFPEFCKHDSCGCGSKLSQGNSRLAVPFSNFISHCDMMWIKSITQLKADFRIIGGESQNGSPLTKCRLLGQPVRRIFSSEEISVSLLGYVKVSPSTGRLQLVDAVGSIDAVVPDLPSTWNMNNVYEVIDYSLVLEGAPEMIDHMQIPDGDSFSCNSILNRIPSVRETKLMIYVHFLWKNVTWSRIPSCDDLSLQGTSPDYNYGTFHLIQITHKYPVGPKFQGNPLKSDRSRTYAEAIVLPWDLYISRNYAAALPAVTSSKVPEEGCLNGVPRKRCKINHTIDYALSCMPKDRFTCNIGECGNSLCDQSNCASILPHEARGDQNSSCRSPVEIPCSVTARIVDCRNISVSGTLRYTRADTKFDTGPSSCQRKVLLEFNPEIFFKYKLLYVGGYYMMRHCKEKCFCDYKDTNASSRLIISSKTDLQSLSFTCDKLASDSDPSNNQPLKSSSIVHKFCVGSHQTELVFHPCTCDVHGSSFDFIVHVTEDCMSLLNALKECVMMPSNTFYNPSISHPVGSAAVEIGLLPDQETSFSGCPSEGDLISLHGMMVALHGSVCSSTNRNFCNQIVGDYRRMLSVQGGNDFVCLHVLTDEHIVIIDGVMSKYDYPVGLGPGARVTFHRILASGQDRFRLAPVSYITLNSVRELTGGCSDWPSNSWHAIHSVCSAHLNPISLCAVSELIQNVECKLRKFRCRVVAIHVVMLARNNNLDKLPSTTRTGIFVTIPLAGFILDDGSSHCCCWATAERATMFLKLHEEMPQPAYESSWWGLKWEAMNEGCATPMPHLDRILKQHGRVVVKNYGSIYDASCQDLQLSVDSGYISGSSDENLLKLITLNACSGTSWSVVGHVMDSEAVSELEKYLMKEQVKMHPMQNVWAREVCHVNALAEARALIKDLQ